MADTERRPAYYAAAGGGWRDWWTLLHPPYTAWHLSYVVIGAALAPHVSRVRLGFTLLAFFLAVGIAAHALDELNGRPLGTTVPSGVLLVLATTSIALAATIGVIAAITVSPWIAVFVVCGVFIVLAYNLELFGGWFHTDLWFAVAWGSFPVLTGYFGSAQTLRLPALLAAGFACATSLAQRHLSSRARSLRRRVTSVSGDISYADGTHETITDSYLIAPAEAALRALAVAMVVLAAALVAARVA